MSGSTFEKKKGDIEFVSALAYSESRVSWTSHKVFLLCLPEQDKQKAKAVSKVNILNRYIRLHNPLEFGTKRDLSRYVAYKSIYRARLILTYTSQRGSSNIPTCLRQFHLCYLPQHHLKIATPSDTPPAGSTDPIELPPDRSIWMQTRSSVTLPHTH